jgi:RNA polymerase sigma factor (sigma-70 family)
LAKAIAGSARALSQSTGQPSPDRIEECVRLAQTGDGLAWSELVQMFQGLLRAVVAGYRLSSADAADVVQTTWLRLAENLNRLEDPSRVGAWLATTARREAVRSLRKLARELPAEQPPEPPHRDSSPVDRKLLQADRDAELWSAFARLPGRDQRLLRMLIADAQHSYEEIARALAMPIGSIGPTRGRALERLRRGLAGSERVDDLAA